MKMKIPAKPAQEVEVCDICHNDGILRDCPACGGKYCITTCEAIIGGCWVHPMVCRKCGNNEGVRKIVLDHANQITPIIEARTKAMKSLNR